MSDENKENIDSIKLDEEYVTVSGPRTQMAKVKGVIGKVDSLKDVDKKNITKKVRLIAVDENGKEVKGLDIENPYVYLNIKMLDSKSVPIKVSLNGDDLPTYKLNEEKVLITGKEEVLKNIQYIETESVDTEELKNKKSIEVSLVIPNNIKCTENKVRVSLDR